MQFGHEGMLPTKHILLMTFLLALLGGRSYCAIIATDPSGQSTSINSLGATIDEEVGNISLSSFNSQSNRATLTFDATEGYSSAPFSNTADLEVVLSSGNSIFASGLTTTFDAPNRLSTANVFGTDYITSGDASLANVDNGTLIASFSGNVGGVAFTVNRTRVDVPIRLYDATSGGNLIASFTLLANASQDNATKNDHSFFGYLGSTNEIRRVELDLGGGSIGIDDFSVATAIPEPGATPVLLVAVIAILLLRKRKRRNPAVISKFKAPMGHAG